MGREKEIAKEISMLVPTLIRHMYPYVFQPIPMPPAQVLAITTLNERGACHLKELSRQMHISAPTVTGIVHRLEKNGYVKRQADKNDRRAFIIELTDKGRKMNEEFRTKIKNRWETILLKLASEDQENIVKMLRKITEGFSRGQI